jgi:hypothetical protein
MRKAHGTKFASASLSTDNPDLKPLAPYYPVSLDKLSGIIELNRENDGKFLCGLQLAVDSSADLT